jgi:hypothetical protein
MGRSQQQQQQQQQCRGLTWVIWPAVAAAASLAYQQVGCS